MVLYNLVQLSQIWLSIARYQLCYHILVWSGLLLYFLIINTSFIVQFIYPLSKTYPLAKSTNTKNNDIFLWLIYWVLNCCFVFLESVFSNTLLFVPFFMEVKCLVLLWLYHPKYQGALYVWHNLGKKKVLQIREFIITQGGTIVNQQARNWANLYLFLIILLTKSMEILPKYWTVSWSSHVVARGIAEGF